MLNIEGLQKNYHGKPVLDIAALKLEQGKIYALIGPNGSGKSTLLRLLAGALTPDAGRVSFHPPLKAQDMAYMPQKTYAFRLSVLKNVMLAAEGAHKAQATAMAMEALRQVGMTELSGQRADTLSGGEAQRMAFARMIMLPRKLLLLDEPTSAADIVGNDLVEEVLLSFVQRTGCTVLFSTHAPAQALKLADEAIALYEGRLCEQGPARQVLTNPQNEDVARFLQHWRLG